MRDQFPSHERAPRQFGALALDEMAASRAPRVERVRMFDPQQPALHATADSATPRAGVVTPVVLQRIERPPAPEEVRAQQRANAHAVPNAQAEAQQILADARTTARTMLSQARDVIAGEREDAIKRGHAEGYAAGLAEADTETSGLIATCERIAVEIMAERERAVIDHEPDLVELAMSIANRIVNASIAVDPDLVIESCRGAMRKAFSRGNLQVLAHPSDLERLRAAGPKLAEELGGVDHLDFVEERRMHAGSVVVRTPAGEIDGTIAGKADKIESALREGIEHRRAAQRDNAAATPFGPAPAAPLETEADAA